MITPTCKELELCWKDTSQFMKMMRTKYCCICVMCGVFMIASLSSVPLTFLIADYVQYGNIDYMIETSISELNVTNSLSNNYHCTYKQMVIDCSFKSSADICWFIDNSTFKKINNKTSIDIARSKYDIDYDVGYWIGFDFCMWFGSIFGFWFVLISFCAKNASLFQLNLYSKLIFIISCIIGFICLLMVGLMGTFVIKKDQNCKNGMQSFLSLYIINPIDINVNITNITANIGQTVMFMIVLCGLDLFFFIVILIFSKWSDNKHKMRIKRYRDKMAQKTKENEDMYHCPSCHNKGYFYGILFQRIVCIDCRGEIKYLMKYTDKTKPKYDAIGSVNMP